MSRKKRVAYRALTAADEQQIIALYKQNKTVDEIKAIIVPPIEDGRQITGVLASAGLYKREQAQIGADAPDRQIPAPPPAENLPPGEAAIRAKLQPEQTGFVGPSAGRTNQDRGNMGYAATQAVPVGQKTTFRILRTTPEHGYVGKMVGQFDLIKLAEQYGNGRYTIEEWPPGARYPSRVTEEMVTGHGDPRHPGQAIFGEGGSSVMPPFGSQAPAASPADFAKVTLDAMKAGVEIAKPAPAAAPPPPSLAEQAGAKVINTALEALTNPPKSGADNWLQNYLQVEAHKTQLAEEARKREREEREEERKRERQEREEERKREKQEADERRKQEREDEDRRRKQEREDEDRRHKMEMEKIKADGEAKANAITAEMNLRLKEIEIKAKAEADAAKALLEAKERIADERLELEQQKAAEAQEATNQALAANESRIDAKMVQLAKENEERIKHQLEVVQLQKDLALKAIEVEKAKASGTDPTIVLVDKLLQNVNDRAKEAIAAKTAQTALEHNPGVVKDALQNPDTMKKIAGGTGVPKIEQLIKTAEFQEFLGEWCLHVEETTPPEFLFETILRQQRNNAPGVNEFIDFITPRRWEKVKAAVWPHITAEQQEILNSDYAVDFYEKLRAMISVVRLQILKSCVKSDLERVEVAMRNEQASQPAPATPATPAATTPEPKNDKEDKKEPAPSPVPATA